MASPLAASADLSTLDRVALEALIAAQQKKIFARDEELAAQQEKLLSRDNEIEHLKLVIAKLRRMIFGTKSEKVSREIEQLELKLEELESQRAERVTASTEVSAPAKIKPVRRPFAGTSAARGPHASACRRCMPGLRRSVAQAG